MANFPDIRTAVIDRATVRSRSAKPTGRMPHSRDVRGVRSGGSAVERGLWVNEVCFWRPDPDDRRRIKRAGRIQDTEDGLSEFPHVIVNQARMLAYLLDHMERSPSRLAPFYGLHASEVEIDTERLVGVSGDGHAPAHAGAASATGEQSTIRAKYVVGCDGARSNIRDRDRPRARRRRDQRVVGRNGCPGGHRLPGHPGQVRDHLRRPGQHPDHPA